MGRSINDHNVHPQYRYVTLIRIFYALFDIKQTCLITSELGLSTFVNKACEQFINSCSQTYTRFNYAFL